jgi:hypothetical protein
MTRKEEIISVMVGDCDRSETWISKHKSLLSPHEISFLNCSSESKENDVGQHDSVGAPVQEEKSHEGKEHEVHEEGGVNDVSIFDV